VIAGHREADGIAIALAWQTRTFRGVPQITEFVKFFVGGLRAFVAWGGTMTVPTTA
jgi:hypothetical protein